MRPPRRTSPLRRWITWSILVLLVGWGASQFVAVRQSILADLHGSHAAAVDSAANAAHSDEGIAEGQDVKRQAIEDLAASVDSRASDSQIAAVGTEPEETQPAMIQTVLDRGKQTDLLIAAGEDALDAGDVVAGRTKLNAALVLMAETPRSAALRDELAGLNTGVFLGPDVLIEDPYAPMVPIAPGDSYQRIAKQYLITAELVAMLNPQLAPRSLRPGTPIKVVFGPFHARIVKSERRMDLYARDVYVRSYPVTIEAGNAVPAGTYRTTGKVGGGGRVWMDLEDASRSGAATTDRRLRLYGSAGPGSSPVSGVRMDDSDLAMLYNVLVEQESFVRVDP